MTTTAAPPRERPILFSGPMVRAILDGRKTQTRRVVKPPKGVDPGHWSMDCHEAIYCEPFRVVHWPADDAELVQVACPYGAPGDRLWVRETFLHAMTGAQDVSGEWDSWYREGGPFEYVADGAQERHLNPGRINPDWMKKRPAIHMPRRASRLLLEVTAVRVERLHALSKADAIAEGATQRELGPGGYDTHGWNMDWSRVGEPSRWAADGKILTARDIHLGSPQMAFANYWIQLNNQASWEANPWVWVVEFREETTDG